MKLTLTKEELLGLLTKAVSATVTDVVICKRSPTLLQRTMNAFRQKNLLQPFNDDIRPDQKIAAIKYFRETNPNTGLAEAKFVIEHWEEYKTYLKTRGRKPKIDASNGWNSLQFK